MCFNDLGLSQLENGSIPLVKSGIRQSLPWHLKNESSSRTVLSKIVTASHMWPLSTGMWLV